MLRYESTLRAATFLCLLGLAATWGVVQSTSTRVDADDTVATNRTKSPGGPNAAGVSVTVAAEKDARDSKDVGDWPLYRGDPASTGVARGMLPDSLELLWKFSVPKGAFEGAAAIAGELAYLADLDGRVYALDVKTGDKRWQYDTKSIFMAAPAVHQGAVYLGDIDGVFYCLEADSGKLRWKYEAGAEIDSGANFHGDHVLFGSQDATLYCLQAKTGQLVWTHAIADQIRCTPTISGDRAFVAGCDGQLHVIDVKLGKEVSAVEIGSPTGVTPAAVGDTVYFGTEGGTFLAVNWKESKIAWTFEDPDRSHAYRSSAAVSGKYVVVGSRSRRVVAMDAKDGTVLWEFATKQRVDSSPVVVGQRVFVGSSDGRLYALDLATGKSLWQYDAGAGFVASPAVAQGRLIIASEDGVVYCFGMKGAN